MTPEPDFFISMDALSEVLKDAQRREASAIEAASERNAQLTKPQGALGQLEEMALWYAGWRGAPRREGCRGQALVFAGNHGVAARGVSPYPADVTAQMVANFAAGGAAINQLCDQHGLALSVHPIRLDAPTRDFTLGPAMDEAEFLDAVSIGWDAVDPAFDAVVLGEMGIGNTTAATALSLALLDGDLESWTGRGAGLDNLGLAIKRQVIAEGLARHRAAIAEAPPKQRGIDALRRLGGREMAAILGAALRARKERMIVLLDGLICSAAVLPLISLSQCGAAHCMATHASAEPAHRAVLDGLGLNAFFDLELRLGEGSGAAIGFGLLQSALRLHAGMATFEEAAVSGPA